MKKSVLAVIAVIVIFSLSACATSSAAPLETGVLDQAVRSSAETIVLQLPQGAKVAVLAFTSQSQIFSDHVIDELASVIATSNKVQVIERQYTDVIRSELNIQMSGDVSDDEVRRVGQQLGAQYVVTGSLADIGNVYRFRVAAINVETAVREGSSSMDIPLNDTQVVFLLTGQRMGQAGNTGLSSSGQVYKVGDIGPAGGYIFYDKGNYKDGWRYLEAAPVETEWQGIEWGAGEQNIAVGTKKHVGSGRQNTRLIIDYLRQRRENGKAAQLCANLDFNGFQDWFLPSRDELALMYKNLYKKGLGNFNPEYYWSSSQHSAWYYPPSQQKYKWYNAYAWSFHIGGRLAGKEYITPKTGKNSVRAVRAF